MFEVQSHQLVNALVERTKDLRHKLTTRILQDHQDINRKSADFVPTFIIIPTIPETGLYYSKYCFSSHRLCNEFENISEKMIIPSDIQELMELKVKTELWSIHASYAKHNKLFLAPFPHAGIHQWGGDHRDACVPAKIVGVEQTTVLPDGLCQPVSIPYAAECTDQSVVWASAAHLREAQAHREYYNRAVSEWDKGLCVAFVSLRWDRNRIKPSQKSLKKYLNPESFTKSSSVLKGKFTKILEQTHLDWLKIWGKANVSQVKTWNMICPVPL